ncbi:hypothetical protein KUTeg_002008 [Tegillarca granosa]|uniref:C-type lectin domain-containing protein n=1 Tax=Tegillarca granosa TaxID=220873 RepID=A0ABQ9FT35_TEGGR|nr:hypothetical protein KUTeg_002008 [Tegillarca granosa]
MIGLSDQRYEGSFRWEGTGETVGLTDWWKGQPDNHKGNEDCVHIARSYGYSWNDIPCEHYKSSYICQKKVAGKVSTKQNPMQYAVITNKQINHSPYYVPLQIKDPLLFKFIEFSSVIKNVFVEMKGYEYM